MGWILALEVVTVMVLGNYLWVRAVRHLAPGFQGQSLQIWFWGPLFARREQFTEAGWRYSRRSTAIALTGLTVFLLTAVLLR